MAAAEEVGIERDLANIEAADLDEVWEVELQQGIEPDSEDEMMDDDIGLLLMAHAGEGAVGQQEKISDFYEEVVPELTDEQFKQQFRLSRDAVRCVLDLIAENCDEDAAIPLEKKLLVCLWYLGSVISLRKVAMVFGLSVGAAWAAVHEVVALLVGLRDRIISIPPKAQLEEVALRFRDKGFPGAIGAVDGCHIQVSRPTENEHAYVNRKHVHAINLMAVADDAGRFMDICVGWPGSVHDSRVFKNSPLGRKLESEQFRRQTLPEQSHILGDAAFQLSTYLVTPFRENQLRAQVQGEPTPREKRYFNFKLSGSRIVVEHAFGRLKGRFRRLHYVETKTVQKAVDITCAACVLHNICTGRGEDWEEDRDDDGAEDQDDVEGNGARVATDGAAAVRKRLELVRLVWDTNAH